MNKKLYTFISAVIRYGGLVLLYIGLELISRTYHTRGLLDLSDNYLGYTACIIGVLMTSLGGYVFRKYYKKETAEKDEYIMKWYAAHIVMYTKFNEGIQDIYPVWENVVLLQSNSDEDALEKAILHGKEEEGDSDGTYKYNNRSATWVFAGVRKIIECVDPKERPSDGTEITYSDFTVESYEALQKLANGKTVTIVYDE